MISSVLKKPMLTNSKKLTLINRSKDNRDLILFKALSLIDLLLFYTWIFCSVLFFVVRIRNIDFDFFHLILTFSANLAGSQSSNSLFYLPMQKYVLIFLLIFTLIRFFSCFNIHFRSINKFFFTNLCSY